MDNKGGFVSYDRNRTHQECRALSDDDRGGVGLGRSV